MSQPSMSCVTDFRHRLRTRFPDAWACRRYLSDVRWRSGFVCPFCAAGSAWPASGGAWLCAACKRRVSVTTGTALHGARISEQELLAAVWFTAERRGTNATELAAAVGLGSPRTALRFCGLLRDAMATLPVLSAPHDAADARRWIWETFHHEPSRDARDAVVAEFAFWHDRRSWTTEQLVEALVGALLMPRPAGRTGATK